MDGEHLIVETGDAEHRVARGEEFTFGRSPSCTVCVDADDTAISRVAGAVEWAGTVWFVSNRSRSRQIAVVDRFGLRRVLGPGERSPIEGRVRVLVEGVRRNHELVFHGPQPAAVDVSVATGRPTSAGESVVISDADRLALVALFAGYLAEGDRYDPAPRSYQAAAHRLGWPRTTLVKRIEYLRTRLSNAGVPNLHGWQALHSLAEYALTTRLITREDLHLVGH